MRVIFGVGLSLLSLCGDFIYSDHWLLSLLVMTYRRSLSIFVVTSAIQSLFVVTIGRYHLLVIVCGDHWSLSLQLIVCGDIMLCGCLW